MRIAALYDIHGNLPALEAVLHQLAHTKIDQVVIGGDVLAGPMPCETLACLLNLPIPVCFIQGNADREVLAQATGGDPGALPEDIRASVEWVARQLPPEYIQLVAHWPPTVTIDIPGLGSVLFCHATPRSDTEMFTRLTPHDRLVPVFAGLDASIVVCGHTHMQFDRTVGTTQVVNAGSVGMPYGEPGAYWLLLGEAIEFRRTPYDRELAATRIRATEYPQAEDFAATNVLHIPSEAEALDVFTQMEHGS